MWKIELRILTAWVSNRTANSLIINWLTSVNMKRTFLHHTSCLISNTITDLARFIDIWWYLNTLWVVLITYWTSITVWNSYFIWWWGCCSIHKLDWHYMQLNSWINNVFFGVYILEYTLWACNDRTTLILSLLYNTVLSDWFCEGTHSKVAHEHSIMASTI